MWWFDVGWSAGGDGWVCPNRFCLLRCRFGVPGGMSDGGLGVVYMCLIVEVHIIFLLQEHLYSHLMSLGYFYCYCLF